jgi:hypothetical protein
VLSGVMMVGLGTITSLTVYFVMAHLFADGLLKAGYRKGIFCH